ncbi:MAG: hypothetical protein AAF740_14995 [Bacteroidota bacterium]
MKQLRLTCKRITIFHLKLKRNMDYIIRIFFRAFFLIRGYRTYRVTTADEQAEINAFILKIFREDSSQSAKLMERYADTSALFVMRHHGQPIAAMRLMNPDEDCQMQDFWNLRLPEGVLPHRVRELGAMAVAKSYRGKSRLPMQGLLDVALQFSRSQGVDWWYASAMQNDYEKFRQFNPNCRELEELPLTPHQEQFRQEYATHFSRSHKNSVLFLFGLGEGLYLANIKRILAYKLQKSKAKLTEIFLSRTIIVPSES